MNYPANIPPAEWDADVDECQACHRLFPVARLVGGEVCYDCAEAGR